MFNRIYFFDGRVPCAYASGSGYSLQVLTGYACCGLFAAIPHADARVHTRRVYALGMRRACVLARMVRQAPKR
jgi:hypothetical protein